MWGEYLWLVIVGGFLCFFMSFGIGANDVANAFATSVGSRTLTLFQAVILAAIFEFAGALLLGRGVSKTISKGLADPDYFEQVPEILMYGMLCALAAAGTWLFIATILELPVSTTHSIVGGVLGFALVAKGKNAVIWAEIDEDEIFPLQGVAAVVISWIFSPVCSGIVSAFFFFVVRATVLRSENSFKLAWFALPVFVGLTFFINAFYVLDKGVSKQWEDSTTAKSAWIGALIGLFFFIITIPIAFLLKKRFLKQEDDIVDEMKAIQGADAAEKGVANGEKSPDSDEKKPSSFFARLQDAVNANDPHAAEDETNTKAIHDHAEVFDPRAEGVFRYLQVITSCADSFAHGANDVANAVGPFATIYAVYKNVDFEEKPDTPEWILVLGGAGIVVGLATFGYHIIKAIGVKLCKITPSRGFCIELGSALIVVTGSYLGLPLSTTHCQVGSTMFVGALEGSKGVSWSIMGRTALGWVFTLIFAGFLSAILMALGIFTPNLRATEAFINVKEAMVASTAQITDAVEMNCPNPTPAFLMSGNKTRQFAEDVEADFQHPNRIGAVLEQLGTFVENSLPTCTPTPLDPAFAALYA